MVSMTFDIVVVGTSLGGLQALTVMLAGLPNTFPAAVVVVQHRHKASDNALSFFLQQYSTLPVGEAEDKEEILPRRVYLAPADYHLLVEPRQAWGHRQGRYGGIATLALSTEAPVCNARPSIDVLFESAADAYAQRVIGVILTGASQDGAKGLAKIKARGGRAIVQEPATAESRIMPEAAIASVTVDWIVQLQDIAPLLVNLCQSAVR